MTKFLVLYRAPHESFEKMKTATPEERKAWMATYMAWCQKAGSALVDMGAPFGPSLHVTPTGSSTSPNDLGGYTFMQAESKEALAHVLEGHPHFGTPGASIEAIEIMAMPGR
jgi:hypothetical protein